MEGLFSPAIVCRAEMDGQLPMARHPLLLVYLSSSVVMPCHKRCYMGPASSIAHYRITSELGEGGMGEVYRATTPS